MKRRNVELTKNRKQFHFRKCKFAEGMVGSNTFLYLKFLLAWILIMSADYILEFRFEYLWPFWLMIRSLYDSFKYQGIIFSIFFALIAFLSDLLFYMFLPVQWMFFAASTYVWVQYVWHTEKGICLPTISLWLLFVYIEASLRLKTLKTIDFCRPFAAHCIGYPMVTLGFGFKSYLSYKLRLKKQKEIRKQNEFHTQLIAKALPLELQLKEKDKFKTNNYDEEILTQQTHHSGASSHSLVSNIFSLIPFLMSSNSSGSQSHMALCNNNNSSNNSNNNNNNNNGTSGSSSSKEKNVTNKSSNRDNCCLNNSPSNQSTGIIASALSFYLNNNHNNNNNNTNNTSSNSMEEAPYIQQKDTTKTNFKASKYHNNSNNNSNNNNNSDEGNLKNTTEYAPKSSFNSKSSNNNFTSSNKFTDPGYTKAGKTSATNGHGNTPESSVNCNLSSFSISSLAYSASSQENPSESLRNTNQLPGNVSAQSNSNNSSGTNGGNNNNNSTGNMTSLNGNLVLLSNSKSENDEIPHHRSSSTSSANSTFLPTSSNNHTNININMTINATAIAAATAQATANAPKLTNGSSGMTKSRKNKDSSSNKTQQRANSVASSTSSSSSSSSGSTANNQQNGVKCKTKNGETENMFSFKDDLISRLEEDLKKLRDENEQQKAVEQYLRNQINYITKCDRNEKQKVEKLQQENKNIQNKFIKLTAQTQKEKDDSELFEKRLQDEKRVRQNLEVELAKEKKLRESQELQILELKKNATTSSNKAQKKANQGETTCKGEQCAKRIKDIELESKKINEEMRKKQDRVMMLECEIKSMNRSRDTESRVDTLMVALNLMEDKNASLQESLSAETRFKLDLFSALGEARRQLESVTLQLKSKERELNAFKALFKQTLSASGNTNVSNSILNNYLSGNSDQSSGDSSTNSQANNNASSNSISSINTTNDNGSSSMSILTTQSSINNEWNTSNGSGSNLSFMPKI